MPESFLERVGTSYHNTKSQETLRVLEMRIGELAPGALPDLSDLRDAATAGIIRLTSPFVFLLVAGKEGTKEVITQVKQRLFGIDIPLSLDERAKEFWDTDLPPIHGVDPNYHHEGIRTKERFIP